MNSRTSTPGVFEQISKQHKNLMAMGESSFIKDEEVDALMETVEKLAEHQIECSKQYKFKEAKETKAKIIEIRKEIVTKRRKAIENRHRNELTQILEAQEEDRLKFNEFWERKMDEYNNEANNVEEQMKNKHEEDISLLKQDLKDNVDIKPMKSTEHIRLKNLVDSLAKVEEYSDAERYYKKCTELEKQEIEKAKQDKEKKIKVVTTQMVGKQQTEMSSLKQKISSGMETMTKMRQDEYEKLQHRFRNMIQEIELAQQLEMVRFESTFKNFVPDNRLTFSPKKRLGTPSSSISDLGSPNTTMMRSKAPKTPELRSQKSQGSQSRPSSAKNLLEILSSTKEAANKIAKATMKPGHKRGDSTGLPK